ncbi:MAG: sulfotransferase [Pararhodobacter sp.]|nr:sulfotransferase [Pararhodobacter sp.]
MNAMTSARANIADILCIGAQRAMTSWLHLALSAHPRLWAFPDFNPVTSTSKEAHYWDWNRHRGARWYRVLMTPLDDPSLMSMDFTPEYAFLGDEQISECKALNPGARVIYIVRDPLARSVSALRMHAMWESDNAAPEALTIGLDEMFFTLMQRAQTFEHADYVENHKRWAQHYPDMLVLDYETLRADPLAGAQRVLAWLGLPCEDMPQAARAESEARARRVVWQTPRYPLTQEALHFLHGALWRERLAAEDHFGLRFGEWQETIEQATDRQGESK